jgi:glyoxylase-like metal-dependent hydrolase (beta-lactamase superfamily II)
MKVFDSLHAFIWQDHSANNCNTYLIDADKKILIDPGHLHLFSPIERELKKLKITPDQIDVVIATHGHPDHLEAAGKFKKPTLFAMNQEEHALISELAAAYFKVPEADFFLTEGDLTIGKLNVQVLVTPGHSPGSICLYWPDRKVLFTGDVVFNQSIGRTDLPGGSSGDLKKSIIRLSKLDVEYLLTGHGEMVTGREKVQENFHMIQDYWFNYL